MPLQTAIQSSVAAAILFAGFHHLFVGFRRRRVPTNLAFGLLCLTVAGYLAAGLAVSWSEDVRAFQTAKSWQLFVGALQYPAKVWFLCLFAGLCGRVFLGVVLAASLVIIGVDVIPAAPLLEITSLEFATLPWGEQVPMPTYGAVTPATAIVFYGLYGLHLCVFLFSLYAGVRLLREGRRREGVLLLSVFVLLFASSMFDAQWSTTEWSWFPTAELGFLALVGIMSFELTDDVVRATEVKRALVESEESLRTTLHSIGEAVLVVDIDGNITRTNPVADGLTGIPEDEARGRPLAEVLALEGLEPRELVANVGSNGGVAPDSATVLPPDARIPEVIDREGRRRRVVHTASQLHNSDGEMVGVVLVMRDVTEHLELEGRLRHAQKLDGIGQLAGGVAHDFNNLLTAINGYAEILVGGLDGSPKLQSAARIIRTTGERAADLTSRLLAFSRRTPRTWEPFSLNESVEQAFGILAHTLDRRIVVAKQLEARADVVLGDGTAMQSAILNLALNARDAMPDGGTLTFRTSGVNLGEEECACSAFDLAPGPHVRLSVSDSGNGIDPELRGRVFEPFFTTKEVGKGTGLGLPAVYGSVKSHGGAVEFESGSLGTTFHVTLPLKQEAAPDAARAAPSDRASAPPRAAARP